MVQATATNAYGDYMGIPDYMPSPAATSCDYQLGANAINEFNSKGDALGQGLTDAFKRMGVEGLKVYKENQGGTYAILTPSSVEYYEKMKALLPEGQAEEFLKAVAVAADRYTSTANKELSLDYALDIIDQMRLMPK